MSLDDEAHNQEWKEKVESALQHIGFINREERIAGTTTTSTTGAVVASNDISIEETVETDSSGNGDQRIDEGKLLEVIQSELYHLQSSHNIAEVESEAMSKWKQLLMPLPYHIVLYILEYNEVRGLSDEQLLGYFVRDPFRKCHLIFRSVYLLDDILSLTQQEERKRKKEFRKSFIMQHVRHVAVFWVDSLPILDQWMRSLTKNSIESLRIDTYKSINHVQEHQFCPAIFSTCKSFAANVIDDYVLKFRNVSELTLDSGLTGANISAVEQLPAHSLTSLSMSIINDGHIQFLSAALKHLRNLKQLHLNQLDQGDIWSRVSMALRNSPPALQSLKYFQRFFNYDDNMRVKILPGMFPSSSSFTQSITDLDLGCYVGNLTGLAAFSHLRSFNMQCFQDSSEVQALYSALCSVPSLTDLKLHFLWSNFFQDKSFGSVLCPLLNIVNGLPSLQNLEISIETVDTHIIVPDRLMSQFLTSITQSSVKLYWEMYSSIGPVSFSADMYRTFLTVLFHPKLRHLLNNFYQDDDKIGKWPELLKAVEEFK